KAFDEPVHISLADVDFFDCPAAFGPVPGRGAFADLLDLLSEYRAAFQKQLETVVLCGIVAPRHLDAALDVEIVSCKVEHGRWSHADPDRVDAAFSEATDQLGFEHRAVRPSVAPNSDR